MPQPARPSRPIARVLSACGLLCAAGLGPQALASDPVELIALDPELARTPISVSGLSDEGAELAGDAGTIALSQLVALVPTTERTSDADAPVDADTWFAPETPAVGATRVIVETVRGHVLLGELTERAPSAIDEDAMVLDLHRVGPVPIALEVVRSVRFAPRTSARTAESNTEASRDDVVVLRNDDRLRGFVVSIEPDAVVIETPAGVRRVAPGAVRALTLANPEDAPSADIVWLADGSALPVRRLRTTPGGALRATLALPTPDPDSESVGVDSAWAPVVQAALDDLVAARFASGRARLVSLSATEPASYEPSGSRRWTAPPERIHPPGVPAGIGDVVLPGPMRVEWNLPARPSRVSMGVRLDAPDIRWASCSVIVESVTPRGVRPLATVELGPDAPTAGVLADLPEDATALIVRIDEGAFGPVHDRVRLVGPVILAERR